MAQHWLVSRLHRRLQNHVLNLPLYLLKLHILISQQPPNLPELPVIHNIRLPLKITLLQLFLQLQNFLFQQHPAVTRNINRLLVQRVTSMVGGSVSGRFCDVLVRGHQLLSLHTWVLVWWLAVSGRSSRVGSGFSLWNNSSNDTAIFIYLPMNLNFIN